MNKMQMISQMAEMIQEDPSLDISEWQSTLHFTSGNLDQMELKDLNAIEGMPEPDKNNMTAVEMSVVSAAKCYATTLHLQAYKNNIELDHVRIVFTGKFAKAPFLGINEGCSGLFDPAIELTMTASAEANKLEEIAQAALDLSPVLSSFKDPVKLVVS